MYNLFSRQPVQWRRPRRLSARITNPVARAAQTDLIIAKIAEIKVVMASGVEGAGYGDKRTDFRSYAELREILNGLEDELAELEGLNTGRPRQLRMTTQWDKGL
jgi:hypothetical protein